ncbi:MAG: hypothetical protein AAB421_05720 [Patescibacteria group bacterium]
MERISALWVGAVVIAFSVFFLLYTHYTALAMRIEFYASILQDAQVNERVVAGRTPFLFLDGTPHPQTKESMSAYITLKALEVAYLKTTARNTPYFPLSGVDLIRFENAIADLGEAQTSLAKIQKNDKDRKSVQEALYPISFLKSLVKTERTRRQFLQSGSDVDAQMYLANLGEVVRAYKHDLSAFRKAFVATVPTSARTYGTAQSTISRLDTLQALDMLSQRASLMDKAMAQRARCFEGTISDCRASDLALSKIPYTNSPHIPTQKDLRQVQNSKQFYLNLGFPVASYPVIALGASTCLQPEKTPPLVAIAPRTEKSSYETHPDILPLGNVRFVKPNYSGNSPYITYFATRDITYIPVKEFTHYNCPTMRSDISRIFTVLALRDHARTIDLKKFANPEQTRNLVLLREKLLANDVVKEADALAYLRVALELTNSGKLPDTETAVIAEIATALKNETATFEWVPTEIARMERKNIFVAERGIYPELTAPFLFYVRSGFFSLMSWPLPTESSEENLLFTGKEHILPNEPFLYLSDLASQRESVRAVHDFKAYYSAYAE